MMDGKEFKRARASRVVAFPDTSDTFIFHEDSDSFMAQHIIFIWF